MLKSPTTAGGGTGGASQQNITEIIQLLESNNINVIEETSTLVRDSLSSTTEPWLLNGLVDYYIQSGNTLVRRLLTGIRQPQHKNLLMKIDEYLQKPSTRYSALNLFGHIVRKDPVWIHHTVQSRAFSTILKCLQLDNDIGVLTVALYVVSTLFPKVPTEIGPCLNHLFGIYVRLINWKHSKLVTAKLNMASFNVALYTLFLCLYGMYPCSFISYLQQYYSNPHVPIEGKLLSGTTSSSPASIEPAENEKRKIFQKCIVPMLQQVRLHPNLILSSKDIEVLNEKWRKMEPHDILAEISQLRLDLKENMFSDSNDTHKCDTDKAKHMHAVSHSETVVKQFVEEPLALDSNAGDTNAELCSIWSPSVELGLSTPPPSRSISPSQGHTNDEKTKSEEAPVSSSQDTQKSKNRPNSLSISAVASRGIGDSTPCTPTQGFSFDYDKTDDSIPCESNQFFQGSSKAGNEFESSHADTLQEKNEMKYSMQLILSHSSGEEAFVDISCDGVSQGQGENRITEFSPALQPSAEHCGAACSIPNPQNLSSKSHDSFFIESKKPTETDILQLPDTRSSLSLSPDEILQREIQLSVESEENIDWMHMSQGTLPEKTTRAMRATILQMQCALLYEKHHREQHAMRSRRLMRKIYEASALEEKNKSLLHIITQKENEVKQLHASLRSQRADFHTRETELQRSLDEANRKIAELSDQLKSISCENMKLRQEKQKDIEAINNANIATKCAKSDMYKCKLQLESEMKNKQTIADLNEQIVQLQRELLVVEELGRKMETIDNSAREFKSTETAKYEMLIDAYKKESMQLTTALREKSVQYDFMKGKAREMEKLVDKKDRLLEEQKKYLENVKSLARSQIQAMEAKYQAQKNITMHMELQVMEQYSKLAALEGHSPSDDCVHQSKSKPIRQHSLGLQYQYGHLMEASPALSPPVKALLLEESSVATSELEASTGTNDPH